MKHYQTIIIGGGLAGLYAAYRLQKQGVKDYLVLEGRKRFGGRIEGVLDGFDLGATWFWADMQPELSQLIDELGIPRFAQYDQGAMLVERSRNEPPKRIQGFGSHPISYRLQGGISALVEAMKQQLLPNALQLGKKVVAIRRLADISEVETAEGEIFYAKSILLALPPRLAAQLSYTPALPDDLRESWANTATWMAPHAKYLAVYEKPFWREQGLSGAGFSQIGPLSELHDISMPNGRAAIFGFFGINAPFRQKIEPEVLKQHCRHQLVRFYGEQASEPLAEWIKDWSVDQFTATQADQNPSHSHPIAPPNSPKTGEWAGNLWGVASEWSPQFGGYLAGAVEAVDLALAKLNQ